MPADYGPTLAAFEATLQSKPTSVNALINEENTGFRSSIGQRYRLDDRIVQVELELNPSAAVNTGPYMTITQTVRQVPEGISYERLDRRISKSNRNIHLEVMRYGFTPLDELISSYYKQKNAVPPTESSLTVGLHFGDPEYWEFTFSVLSQGVAFWLPFEPNSSPGNDKLAQEGRTIYDKLTPITDSQKAFKVMLDKIESAHRLHNWPLDILNLE
jgi:hypothetical protein